MAVVNVGAVLVGFAFYKMCGPAYQLAVQVPVAVLISVAGFALWYFIAGRIARGALALRGSAAYFGTYVLAFAWLPALFVPLHYVTQGYLTSFANVYCAWLFQAPTNALALVAAYLAGRRRAP